MFTGIVEELGELTGLDWHDHGATLRIRGPLVTSDAVPGDSVAVSGVCLTVIEVQPPQFRAEVMKQTLDRTSLGALEVGAPVNLERPLTLATRLGGHLVQGHVDGVGTIIAHTAAPLHDEMQVSLPRDLSRYVVVKGSICVDGVSLTVIDVDETSFSVGLIPTTLGLTTLGHKTVGAPVNLEVDVLAKYVEKLLSAGGGKNE